MALPIVHDPLYHAEIAADHRFPMGKFRRVAEVLIDDGLVTPDEFHVPGEAPADWLCLVHREDYVEQVLAADVPAAIAREIGLPMVEAVGRRAAAATAGTVLAGRLALAEGIACNTAGGSHHARAEQGAGFCVFNDVAVAIRVLQREGRIERAMVIDCDVHQGDGTASIFTGDPAVFTFSIHAEKNYPARKVPSDLDLPVEDDLGDRDYVALIRQHVRALVANHRPDIVFYNAGVDPHADDRLGRLALSDDGLTERDRYVIDAVRETGVPLAGVLGGGYDPDLERLARRHTILHRVAAEFV
ncbi:histone deacetylase family protein [Segnochrobactrum spirostomi]|uniref:Histone deacetylase n=1 Tax=Segnochrobactrum spirostomi TaxID=2608987 RepID=A0A6A7Y422_9HYPH|nr:histone deacetylase [Segnochrobactrum spirostomi]MQT12469.1 histone deacetylase [Segnochrobactrum spirostomi]